jgi:hypothetical protein
LASFRGRAALQFEILALRHQLAVLQRSVKRPKLTAVDRLLWAWFAQTWRDWRSALVIVKPETVIAWHRKGLRLFWTWKVRRGRPGRPPVPTEVRELIRKMSRENPLWGAPRIHGERLKLGIDIGETSVGRYMARVRKPPAQTWRTFLENHSPGLKGPQPRPDQRGNFGQPAKTSLALPIQVNDSFPPANYRLGSIPIRHSRV